MGEMVGRLGISILMVVLSFLAVFLLGVNAGGIPPLALYLVGLLLGSIAVAFLASRLGVKPGDLATVTLTIVPILLVAVLGLLKIVASFIDGPISGPTEGEGIRLVLLFLLLPAVLLGLLGSLFELTLWRKDRESSMP